MGFCSAGTLEVSAVCTVGGEAAGGATTGCAGGAWTGLEGWAGLDPGLIALTPGPVTGINPLPGGAGAETGPTTEGILGPGRGTDGGGAMGPDGGVTDGPGR